MDVKEECKTPIGATPSSSGTALPTAGSVATPSAGAGQTAGASGPLGFTLSTDKEETRVSFLFHFIPSVIVVLQ